MYRTLIATIILTLVLAACGTASDLIDNASPGGSSAVDDTTAGEAAPTTAAETGAAPHRW